MDAKFDPKWFKIDPHSMAPLYYQIKQNLQELVESGAFQPGHLLPAEGEMGEYYGVSRLTVRQAVGELVREGLLRRERGVGTFVCSPKMTHSMLRTAGFSERMREAGHTPSSQVLGFEVIGAPSQIAARLRLQVDEPIYKLSRLRCADGEPHMIETTYFSQTRFPGMEQVDFSQTSLYSTLAQRFNCLMVAADEVFEPVILRRHEMELLKTKPNTPGLLLDVVAYDQDNTPVEYTRSIVRGDKARMLFHVRRQIWQDQETRIEWISSEALKKG